MNESFIREPLIHSRNAIRLGDTSIEIPDFTCDLSRAEKRKWQNLRDTAIDDWLRANGSQIWSENNSAVLLRALERELQWKAIQFLLLVFLRRVRPNANGVGKTGGLMACLPRLWELFPYLLERKI